MRDTSNELFDKVFKDREAAYKHERLIVASRQMGRKVQYQGVYAYVAGVCLHKGDTELTVYLEGRPDPVKPTDISIPEALPD